MANIIACGECISRLQSICAVIKVNYTRKPGVQSRVHDASRTKPSAQSQRIKRDSRVMHTKRDSRAVHEA